MALSTARCFHSPLLLHGDLAGLFSIRINDQWRIVFRWHDGNAYEVRLTDYH